MLATRLSPASYTFERMGATFHRDGTVFSPSYGFAVGIKGIIVPMYRFSDAEFDGFAAVLDPEVKYVGTWVDGEFVHLDAVEFVDELMDAVLLGNLHNQEAIYSFGLNECIYLKDEGRRLAVLPAAA